MSFQVFKSQEATGCRHLYNDNKKVSILIICEGYITLQPHSFMVYYHLKNCFRLNGKPTKS